MPEVMAENRAEAKTLRGLQRVELAEPVEPNLGSFVGACDRLGYGRELASRGEHGGNALLLRASTRL